MDDPHDTHDPQPIDLDEVDDLDIGDVLAALGTESCLLYTSPSPRDRG